MVWFFFATENQHACIFLLPSQNYLNTITTIHEPSEGLYLESLAIAHRAFHFHLFMKVGQMVV